jgi:hypothetical protein
MQLAPWFTALARRSERLDVRRLSDPARSLACAWPPLTRVGLYSAALTVGPATLPRYIPITLVSARNWSTPLLSVGPFRRARTQKYLRSLHGNCRSLQPDKYCDGGEQPVAAERKSQPQPETDQQNGNHGVERRANQASNRNVSLRSTVQRFHGGISCT